MLVSPASSIRSTAARSLACSRASSFCAACSCWATVVRSFCRAAVASALRFCCLARAVAAAEAGKLLAQAVVLLRRLLGPVTQHLDTLRRLPDGRFPGGLGTTGRRQRQPDEHGARSCGYRDEPGPAPATPERLEAARQPVV